jgi:hypothetical protein
MTLSEFLTELFAAGRVAVPEPAVKLAADEREAARRVLAAQDELCRLEMAGEMPPFDEAAAEWTAIQFYSACQLAVFRDIGEPAIVKLGESSLAGWDKATVHYSVDLVFRFLPDLVRIVQTAASADPLVALLMTWARRWPLSSVGIAGVGDVPLGPLLDSPVLMRLYVDRIVAREDTERLASEPVRRAVRQALGLYPKLAPKLTAFMATEVETRQ